MEHIELILDCLVPDWVDKLATLIGFFTLIFTVWNWYSTRKLNKVLDQDIKIILKHKAETKELPHTIKRRHFTRSEVQGILANCYSEKHYNISYLGKRGYSNQIIEVQNNKSHELIIPIDEEDEYKKFMP